MWLVSCELNFTKTFDELPKLYSYRQMRDILELSIWHKNKINQSNKSNDEIQLALRDHRMLTGGGYGFQ